MDYEDKSLIYIDSLIILRIILSFFFVGLHFEHLVFSPSSIQLKRKRKKKKKKHTIKLLMISSHSVIPNHCLLIRIKMEYIFSQNN